MPEWEDSGPLFAVRGGQKPYSVSLDLTGGSAHFCACPDGAYRVELDAGGGSLCKHVLACILKDKKEFLLAAHLCALARESLATCG